jgi:hypothetical protein
VSAPLVAAVLLASIGVAIGLPMLDPALGIASVVATIAAALMAGFGVAQRRISGIAPALACLGVAIAIAGVIAATWYRVAFGIDVMLRVHQDHMTQLDAVTAGLDRIRAGMVAESAGATLAIGGLAAMIDRRWLGTVATAIASAGVLLALRAPLDATLADALAGAFGIRTAWFVGLAVVTIAAGAPASSLDSRGFRVAGRGLWLCAFVAGIGFGTALAGSPSAGTAHDILHAIRLALVGGTIVGLCVGAWGLVDAARLAAPVAGRWLLVVGAACFAIGAAGLLVLVPAFWLDRRVVMTLAIDIDVLARGLGGIATMIGLAVIVRRHGFHELRRGVVPRTAAITILLVVVIAVLDGGSGPSPATMFRAIAIVAIMAIPAHECIQVSHRLRPPALPLAKVIAKPQSS